MPESIQTISQRGSYTPSAFTRFFLWWLSTAEKELLKDCVIDRNRYAITGITVLGTWLFATLAWSYFFYTVTSSVWLAVPLGIFMGGIILGIDRALIKGINGSNKKKIVPLAFRLLLALTIGTFMAQPALLYLFDKEIHVQIALDNVQRQQQQLQKQDSLYREKVNGQLLQKAALQLQLNSLHQETTIARDNFLAETDGTGGSHKPGLKDIARAKQTAYEKLESDYQQLNLSLQPKINNIDSVLAEIASAKQKEVQAFTRLLNDGFLTRTEALHNLLEGNTAARYRYYLLIIILVLIELMPVIAKTILPDGSFAEKTRLQEKMETDTATDNYAKEKELKALYNQLAFEQDQQFLQNFFTEASAQRAEKMKQQFTQWSLQQDKSFDDFWEGIKKDMLTRQEN